MLNPVMWIGMWFSGWGIYWGLRHGPDTRRIQVRAGELNVVDVARGEVSGVETIPAAELDWSMHVAPMPLRRGALSYLLTHSLSEPRGWALRRLVEIYLAGGAPREALLALVGQYQQLAALLGRNLVAWLKEAEPTARVDDAHCQDCRAAVAPGAPRCPYCGLLLPTH